MTEGIDAHARQMMQANEDNWDARTPIHVGSDFYGLDGGWDPQYWFLPSEWEDLGELVGRDVLHLQCHLGTETQAFAQRGARSTVGVDFSAEAVRHARRLAAEHSSHAEYVQANVYDAVAALDGRQFDVIYTGKGSLCYLPDLHRWVDVLTALLRPGGLVYIVEFHPLLNALGEEPGHSEDLLLRHDYLEGRGAVRRDGTHTYTDGPAVQGATTVYEWRHGLGEVVTALAAGGLQVSTLREYEEVPWQRWSTMVSTQHGWWRLPPESPRIPLFFALTARKTG